MKADKKSEHTTEIAELAELLNVKGWYWWSSYVCNRPTLLYFICLSLLLAITIDPSARISQWSLISLPAQKLSITPQLNESPQHQLCKCTGAGAYSGPRSGDPSPANHSPALHCLTLLRPMGALQQNRTRNSRKQQTRCVLTSSSCQLYAALLAHCLFQKGYAVTFMSFISIASPTKSNWFTFFYFVDFLVRLLHEKLSA